jgi:hypothetical protein
MPRTIDNWTEPAEPVWLVSARNDIGLREIPGAPTAPRIQRWLVDLRAWWTDDETPWCGVAVAAWMRSASVALPRFWMRARAWADWGQPLDRPAQLGHGVPCKNDDLSTVHSVQIGAFVNQSSNTVRPAAATWTVLPAVDSCAAAICPRRFTQEGRQALPC